MAGYDLYTIARFWSRVAVDDDENACWVWRGNVNDQGYGRFRRGGEIKAHRFAWTYFNGPIPEGAMILHSCDNPPCVNPHHLRPGTAKDNIDDCWSRDRGVRLASYRRGADLLLDRASRIKANSWARLKGRDLRRLCQAEHGAVGTRYGELQPRRSAREGAGQEDRGLERLQVL